MTHRLSGRVVWGEGPVGDAVRRSEQARLRRFIRDEESETVALFTSRCREVSDAGEWYGEHLGKWLISISHACHRTGDSELADQVRRVVDFILAQQEADGYLGTYREDAACRFTSPDAEDVRTWDIWVHAWTILGLLKVAPLAPGALAAAVRIGDLLLSAFPKVHRSVLDLGNHAGLSSSVLIEPLAELTLATGDPRYAGLALETFQELSCRLGVLSKSDVAEIGTGKAYQICWNLVGLVALYRAVGEPKLLKAAEDLWTNIAEEHLTPLGGPWGGVAGHKEVFNAKGYFSPYGMVETCSAATWMTLSRELFRATGNPRYVEAFERTLMNTLLGALDENGGDWCYFTFPNGRRNNTYHWACCKSSGAMALEECSDMAASATDEAIWLNLLLPCHIEIEGARIEVTEEGDDFRIEYQGDRPLKVRIPKWAESDDRGQDGLITLFEESPQRSRSEILKLRRPFRVIPKTYSVDHHGQEVVLMDYACLSRGPYVYATGLIDGYRKEETLRLPRLTPEAPFRLRGDEIDLHIPGRDPIPFAPYFRAGGRHEGAWRTTWLQIAWQ